MELLIGALSMVFVTDSQVRDVMGLVDVPESGDGDGDPPHYCLMSLTLSQIARCLFLNKNSWLVMLWIYAVLNLCYQILASASSSRSLLLLQFDCTC